MALQGLGHLALLDLSENQISILQNRDFEGISPGLMELRMSGCGLHSISDSAFYGVGSLKTLDLSNNGLSVAPNRAFGYVKHLEELSIGRNKLRTLQSGDFLFLERLKLAGDPPDDELAKQLPSVVTALLPFYLPVRDGSPNKPR